MSKNKRRISEDECLYEDLILEENEQGSGEAEETLIPNKKNPHNKKKRP